MLYVVSIPAHSNICLILQACRVSCFLHCFRQWKGNNHVRKHLTDAFVKSVPLPNKHKGAKQQRYIQKIERGLSLVLVVSYQGTKSFNVLTYKDGQPKTY